MRRSFPRVILALAVLMVGFGLLSAATTCPSCGTGNKDSDKFCKSCGARLPEPPPPKPSTPRVSGAAAVSGPGVRITSRPAGAEVNIDGQYRGRTPLQLGDLQPGRHDYELIRSGYRPFYGEFTIAGRFGSIVVATDPVGAEVLLNGESRGVAPDSGLALTGIRYGRHTITARLDGYNDAVKTVDLASAGPVRVTCLLGYGKGWLVVNSEPPGASLAVNSNPAGKTPYSAELDPARYALRLLRPGYHDWIGDANVQYSESTMVRAVLDRLETRKLPLLIAALAGVGAGVGAALKGESEYSRYSAATTQQEAERYRRSTVTWDLTRNLALGAGLALGVAYWTLTW